MALIFPKCPLSPGLTINLWCQLPPTWNTAGRLWQGFGELALFCDSDEVQLQRGSRPRDRAAGISFQGLVRPKVGNLGEGTGLCCLEQVPRGKVQARRGMGDSGPQKCWAKG